MRQLNLPLLFLAAIVSLFMACKKEPLREKLLTAGIEKNDLGPGAVGTACTRSVRLVCGMLSFNDQAHFQETYDCLEAAYEAHLDAFEAQYGNLSEDDYNDMADQLGFVDEQTLIDFEGAMGFSSYRAYIFGEEDVWLNNGGDPQYGPGATNLFEDDIEAALMNKYGAVMIGGVIYLTLADGSVIEFCSCELYDRYLQDPSSVDLNDPCITLNKHLYYGNGTCCKSYQQEKGGHVYDSDKKITWTLLFEYNQHVDNARSFAKIRHWRLKNNKWRPRRADLLARADGRYSQPDCKEGSTYTKTKAKKRKTLKATYWHWQPATIITFKTADAKGYWEYPQSNYFSHALQFPC